MMHMMGFNYPPLRSLVFATPTYPRPCKNTQNASLRHGYANSARAEQAYFTAEEAYFTAEEAYFTAEEAYFTAEEAYFTAEEAYFTAEEAYFTAK